MADFLARSVNGVAIRLTEERWRHIVRVHPEMADKRADIREAIELADSVHEGRGGALVAVRRMDRLYLTVVYREIGENDGFVISSYLTRRPGTRRIVWRRN